ncbi:hypothetical protein PXH80_34090, partial [Mycolicibacterium smegmatis]|nr:hypothetical protein [Mycolicibacterium smegmatis]
GAKVVVADVADDKGAALEKELGIRYVRTDATSEESVLAAIADPTVVILNPGAGDAVQAAKAGVLEVADLVVVNKADRDG